MSKITMSQSVIDSSFINSMLNSYEKGKGFEYQYVNHNDKIILIDGEEYNLEDIPEKTKGEKLTNNHLFYKEYHLKRLYIFCNKTINSKIKNLKIGNVTATQTLITDYF